MSIRFTQSSYLLLKTPFEQIGETNSTVTGVPKLFGDLLNRACARNQTDRVDALIQRDVTLVCSHTSSDVHLAQFEAMLAYAAALIDKERSSVLGLRHLLVASFEQLKANLHAQGHLSLQQYQELLTKASVELSAADGAEWDQSSYVEVSFAVICAGAYVEDYENQYESLADAVRAKKHIERRAGLRSWPSASDEAHRNYVLMLMPGKVESVTDVAIRITI